MNLFNFSGGDWSDAIFNAVILVFAHIFFFQWLGTLIYRVTNVDFWDIATGHFGSYWLIINNVFIALALSCAFIGFSAYFIKGFGAR